MHTLCRLAFPVRWTAVSSGTRSSEAMRVRRNMSVAKFRWCGLSGVSYCTIASLYTNTCNSLCRTCSSPGAWRTDISGLLRNAWRICTTVSSEALPRAHPCRPELVKAGHDGFPICRITFMHSSIVSLHRNDFLSSCHATFCARRWGDVILFVATLTPHSRQRQLRSHIMKFCEFLFIMPHEFS
jgi:hypothetical protein